MHVLFIYTNSLLNGTIKIRVQRYIYLLFSLQAQDFYSRLINCIFGASSNQSEFCVKRSKKNSD